MFSPSRSHQFLRPALVLTGLLAALSMADPAAAEEPVPPAQKEPVPAAAPLNRTIEKLGLELIWIKPGTFVMGSPPHEADRNKAEGPQTEVTLTRGFWLGKTPVTQGQYEAVAGSNPSHFKAVGKDAPVEEVSWVDAMDYCHKLTGQERTAGLLPEGYAYTLPTEAQWEYVRRAGKTEAYAGNPDTMAWHKGNSDGTTHPVATKEANAWGLFDLSGNVLQWCFDWFGDYPGGAVTDPTGPDYGHFRMARGGSWRMGPELCRSAARAGGSAGRRDYTIGFRLALSPVRPAGEKAPER